MPGLREDKLKALQELIGKDAAGALLSSLKERDKMADDMKVGFKSMDGAKDDLSAQQQAQLLDAVMGALGGDTAETEKCTPGTKDGKYMAGKSEHKAEYDMAEDDGEMDEDMAEDDGEMEDDEMLLSKADVKAIASEVAKAMASTMSEMKAYMKRGKSLDGGDAIETLKEYTQAHTEFSEQIVASLEELLTRVKALEANGTGHAPSQTMANAVKNMQSVYAMTPEQHVENWLFNNR